MPIYEYFCNSCGNKFELLIKSEEKTTTPECTKCSSNETEKSLSLFGGIKIGTNRKDACPSSSSCGSSESCCSGGACPMSHG